MKKLLWDRDPTGNRADDGRLAKLLDDLPSDRNTLLIAYYCYGISLDRISRVLGISKRRARREVLLFPEQLRTSTGMALPGVRDLEELAHYHPRLSEIMELTAQRFLLKPTPCRHCRRPIPPRGESAVLGGRRRWYCSNACRQREYRQRRRTPQ